MGAAGDSARQPVGRVTFLQPLLMLAGHTVSMCGV